MIGGLLTSFNALNKTLNNTNTFLLDISIPIINYLLNKNDDIDNFLLYMLDVENYIHCECHSKLWEEFHQHVAGDFHEYCSYLLDVVDENKCDEKISQFSGFADDFRTIKTDLIEERVDRVSAEAALLWWQGAVPDTAMQEAIVQLRYDYIKSLLKTRLPNA